MINYFEKQEQAATLTEDWEINKTTTLKVATNTKNKI